MLNEVLIDNQSNFQDDYGLHSAWIEVFNKSYGSADLAGCLLKVSNQPGDTVTYLSLLPPFTSQFAAPSLIRAYDWLGPRTPAGTTI